MKQASPARQRLTALGLLGLLLMTYPMLSLPSGFWGGLPATYLYLFGVWAALIALAARVAGRREK